MPASAAWLAFGGLLVLNLINPRYMGMGDVKLAFVLGVFLGWWGMGYVPIGLFLGFLLGSIGGIALIAAGLKTRKDHIPFAPFLSAGALLAVFVGQSILDWYTPKGTPPDPLLFDIFLAAAPLVGTSSCRHHRRGNQSDRARHRDARRQGR